MGHHVGHRAGQLHPRAPRPNRSRVILASRQDDVLALAVAVEHTAVALGLLPSGPAVEVVLDDDIQLLQREPLVGDV